MKINYQHQPVRHSFEIDDDDLRFCRSEDEVRNHIYTRVEYAAVARWKKLAAQLSEEDSAE